MELRAKYHHRLKGLGDISYMQRLTNADWWTTRATWTYEHVSDFGRSFTKPIMYYLWLLIITYLIALVCAATTSPALCAGEVKMRLFSDLNRENRCDSYDPEPKFRIPFSGYRAASEYTLANASALIQFSDRSKLIDIHYRLFGEPLEPMLMRLLGLFTPLVSTVLFFFIGLAYATATALNSCFASVLSESLLNTPHDGMLRLS